MVGRCRRRLIRSAGTLRRNLAGFVDGDREARVANAILASFFCEAYCVNGSMLHDRNDCATWPS